MKTCVRVMMATVLAVWATSAEAASEIKVGFITSLTGPASSIGIPYRQGVEAGLAHIAEISGHPIKLIILDDATDPAVAVKDARKLIEEEKVDIILGSAAAPASLAIAGVARDAHIPLIITASAVLPGEDGAGTITIPQPFPLMIEAVVARMKAAGSKTVGYIGFSDAFGDLVFSALKSTADAAGITIVANERYARTDTSVAAQALKVIAADPDAIITGGSGSPGALPYLALAERGYRGTIYGTHALINPDFVRIAGDSVEGMIAPTGPVVVSEQLPDSNPIKAVGAAFRAALKKSAPTATANAFSAYAFDAWLVFADSATRALAKAEPGSDAFRTALKDAMTNTKSVVGTHAVYSFKPTERYGVDDRARVLVKLDKGKWTLLP